MTAALNWTASASAEFLARRATAEDCAGEDDNRRAREQERERNPPPTFAVYRRRAPPVPMEAIRRAVAIVARPRDREDLRQELAVKWLQARHPVADAKNWAFIAAKNLVIERSRKTARRGRLLERWGTPAWATDEDSRSFGFYGARDVEDKLADWIDKTGGVLGWIGGWGSEEKRTLSHNSTSQGTNSARCQSTCASSPSKGPRT